MIRQSRRYSVIVNVNVDAMSEYTVPTANERFKDYGDERHGRKGFPDLHGEDWLPDCYNPLCRWTYGFQMGWARV